MQTLTGGIKVIVFGTVSLTDGRDGFWLARWLQARGIEAHVIHSTSVAVNREHRRAKTDRPDTAMRKHPAKGAVQAV